MVSQCVQAARSEMVASSRQRQVTTVFLCIIKTLGAKTSMELILLLLLFLKGGTSAADVYHRSI